VTQADTQFERSHQQPPGGRLAVAAGSVTALVIATLAGSALTFWHQAACRAGAFNDPAGVADIRAHCYSDIYALYTVHGLDHGHIPYLDRPVEYPVLIGGAMQAASWAVRTVAGDLKRNLAFYDVTTAGLVLFAIAGVLATAYLAGRSRRWTALLVALSPALILAAFINWDLIAMGLTAAAMAAWAARRGVLAGVLFGLAVATKFYPLILLAALFPLCLRAGRQRAFWVTMAAAAVTWLAVNLPVAIVALHNWSTFYRNSASRIADWGSIWFPVQRAGWFLNMDTLNLLVAGLILLGFVLIGLLVLAAPRRPRVPQVLFLALAVFLLLNKVWSVQYVIWLVPLVVLARPRLWSYLLWQAAEVGYFLAFFPWLITAAPYAFPRGVTGGLSTGLYYTALLSRFLTVALLGALVVRDILRPEKDVVRRDGDDDPAGGVLDGAPDTITLRLRPRPRPGSGARIRG
jgi:uncharacterized membrane protein